MDTINRTTACRAALYDLADTAVLRSSFLNSTLVVNATTVGMAPNINHSVLEDTSLFHSGLLVADIIYNPRETQFLSRAKAAGCRTFNGLHMLLYQGAEAFRLWTGRQMPVKNIKEKYLSQCV